MPARAVLLALVLAGVAAAQTPPPGTGRLTFQLAVPDVEAAERFYVDVLGLERVEGDALGIPLGRGGGPDAVRTVVAQGEALWTVLHLGPCHGPCPAGARRRAGGTPLVIPLATPRLDRLLVRLKAAGVEVLGPIERGGRRRIRVQAPGGQVVEIVGAGE